MKLKALLAKTSFENVIYVFAIIYTINIVQSLSSYRKMSVNSAEIFQNANVSLCVFSLPLFHVQCSMAVIVRRVINLLAESAVAAVCLYLRKL